MNDDPNSRAAGVANAIGHVTRGPHLDMFAEALVRSLSVNEEVEARGTSNTAHAIRACRMMEANKHKFKYVN